MNKNDYYLKYLKYKMKYLHEKEMQIGGREFDMKILYGTTTPPSTVRVDTEMTWDDFIKRIPDYKFSGFNVVNKILFESTGQVKLGRTYNKIGDWKFESVMVKYEYSIHVKVDRYTPYEMKVLNTDLIDVIYDRLGLEGKQHIMFVEIVEGNETKNLIYKDDKRTLEQIGIRPECGLYPECGVELIIEQ